MKYPITFKYRFELLLPLTDNEGNPFEPDAFFQVQKNLLDQFGGYRCQPLAPHIGAWTEEAITYYDKLLMFTVDAPRADESLDWFIAYKEHLKPQFQQVEIYLAVGEVLWL
jgi:hypothetical protein